MIEAFNEYIKNYDLKEPYIKLKYDHSFRVMKLMENYARLLNYSEEDVYIAKLIGILHDIGRFPQYTKYASDIDCQTMDHADYGVKELFKNGKIKMFTQDESIYPILEFAIKNHNKLNIPEQSDERILKFTKLIRDIDKLDIIYLLGYLKEEHYKITKEPITKEVLDEFYSNQQIDITKCKIDNDWIVAQLAFTYDINNDIVLKEYKRNLTYYINNLDKEIFKNITDHIMKYIDERIEKYEGNRN